MQRKWLSIIFIFSFLLFNSSQAATLETYTLDPNHSYVLWHISHFGFSNPSGKWPAQGTISVDEADPQNSHVKVTIQIGDLVTGIAELDKHLKSKVFFDAEQFPTATFVSDRIELTGKTTALIHGILSLHGVSKPVTLEAKLNKKGENPINNKLTLGFSATAKINRSDFGIKTLLPGLGDEVLLDIEVEAAKTN